MNIEFNKVTWYSKLLAFLVVVAIFVFAFLLGRKFQEAASLPSYVAEVPEAPASLPQSNTISEVAPTKSSTDPLEFFTPSSPLNSMGGVEGYSNIVGYFGGGNFFWYVPQWLVDKWESENTRDGGMIFTPRAEFGSYDFSSIIIYLATTTESFNAETLYTQAHPSSLSTSLCIVGTRCQVRTDGSPLYTSDIFLSTVGESRIYHIAYELDNGMIEDKFFIDGWNMTATITFSAPKETSPLYQSKIKEVVNGLGKGEGPRG